MENIDRFGTIFERFYMVWGEPWGPLGIPLARFGSTWNRFELTLTTLWGLWGEILGFCDLMYVTFVLKTCILSRILCVFHE